jgi:hypothetical protein
VKLLTDTCSIEREVHSLRTTTNSGSVHRLLVGSVEAVDRAIVSHAMTLGLNGVNYVLMVRMERVLLPPDLGLMGMIPLPDDAPEWVYATFNKGGYFVPDKDSYHLLARLQGSTSVGIRVKI